MSQYPNGQGYYSQPANPPQPLSNRYPTLQPGAAPITHGLRRTSSFEAGDDALTADRQPSSGGPTGGGNVQGYGGNGNQANGHIAATPSSPQPQTSWMPTYPPASPANFHDLSLNIHRSHNITNVGSGYGSIHRPYNPAAYQQSTYGQTSYPSQSYAYPVTNYTPPYPTSNQALYMPSTPPLASEAQQDYPARRPSQYSPYQQSQSQVVHGHPTGPTSAPLPIRESTHNIPLPRPTSLSPTHDVQDSPVSNVDRPASGSSAHSGQPYYPPPPIRNHHPLPSPPAYVFRQPSDTSISPNHLSSASTSSFERYANEVSQPPVPPQHSPQRSMTSGRHPQARPLPGPPQESDTETEYLPDGNGNFVMRNNSSDNTSYDDIFKEVEEAVMGAGSSSQVIRRSPRLNLENHSPIKESDEPQPLFSHSARGTPTRGNLGTSGTFVNTNTSPYGNYNPYSSDSDAEAAAGVVAMRIAEEEEARLFGRSNNGSSNVQSPQLYDSEPADSRPDVYGVQEDSSDNDYHTMDMGALGGGFDAHLSYGAATSPESRVQGSNRPLPSPGVYNYPMQSQETIHPFQHADTGGLSEPTVDGRRMSFEEGDEVHMGELEGSSGDDIPDLFFHPGMSSRPLPPAPIDTNVSNWQLTQQYDSYGRPYPSAPDAYGSNSLNPNTVPRSTSLISHSSAPQAVPPARAKTDAEDRKYKILKVQTPGTRTSAGDSDYEIVTPALDLPTLPTGRRKKYNPAKISSAEFKKCTEPWALSSLSVWLANMTEGEADLKEQALVDGLVALFTHKVATMNIADAETLGARVVKDFLASGVLVKDEEWVKFGLENASGVIWQLTGSGCYAPKLHSQEISGRCYSHHCSRTLRKINLQTDALTPQRKHQDWATFYKLKKEDVEGVNKKEIERQNNLHEIVQTEDEFMDQLNVLRLLYRDQLLKLSIISPKRQQSFVNEVFGKVEAVKKANEDYLLAQLKYRQQEQGPWVVGFSDIFREWIRKAKNAYIDYSASFPNATLTVRKEAERNVLFRQFLDQVRNNELSRRLGWDTYLKSPITRLQRYSLLLSTVHKHMMQDSEEKTNLQTAIDEIKAVTLECDNRVAEMQKKVDMAELAAKLVLRPGMERVELNLNHLGRELIHQGDLQRIGTNRFTWLETHAILFDHYLVLAKTVLQREGGRKKEIYDISKLPIPMDLLVLDSTNDDPVVKTSVKGIASVTNAAGRVQAQPQNDIRLGRTPSDQSSPGPSLKPTKSDSSANATNGPGNNMPAKMMVTNTVLEGPKDEKLLFPFKVKHLGKSELYTLFAPSSTNRQEWCEKIIEAKTRHAAALFSQNAEPFRLRVMADTAFATDSFSFGQKGIVIRGTPLDRAIRDAEQLFEKTERPGPVCRAQVNCATTFQFPYGRHMVAVGTDFGVYISEYSNPRGWTRAIHAAKVTQVAVLEEFGLFLVLADKSLVAYHLDVVCTTSNGATTQDSSRKAPQRLSGSRDVGFFALAKMKDRRLVVYKKKDGISSTFKILEPVFQKSTEKKHRFSRKGTTDFFREFDEFYIPTDCFTINLFHSSLAVSTSRGFEVLTLDKKQPWSVPDLKAPHVQTIASRLANQKPMGMFRLSETEFLNVYEECAVYVNKHGDVSRSVIMEFVGKAKMAAMYGPYLLVFDQDFIEIRNAQNGRLRQVIAGKDVRCLDDAQSTGTGTGTAADQPADRTVKICMQHPEMERSQIVLELLLNEGQRE